ncbi:MAG: DUF547 domain-containing protein [Myxococcota bacterium]|nr:DUF547 domain-containing protein [Myxococcota bacterium]
MLAFISLLSCQERLPVPKVAASDDAGIAWYQLLRKASHNQDVDYALIKRQRIVLDQYMVWLAHHGPRTEKYSIREEDRKIVFYANAYNAAVIYAVLQNEPIESVQDVHSGSFRYSNSGFFLGQLFLIDGEWMSLFHLEQDLFLSQFQDPRLHVMLNCASKGCPPVRYWTEQGLERQLDRAWTSYIENNVRKTESGWAVSELFFWYEKDLIGWSDAETLCDYFQRYAKGNFLTWLQEDRSSCTLQSFSYDWSLNDASSSEPVSPQNGD